MKVEMPGAGSDNRRATRYVTLDGLRGVAAIAVALFHFAPTMMPGGYLAVDFFFALSGFVLVRTYERRLLDGLGATRFMIMRAIRLFPLHLCGIVLGAAFAVQGILRSSNGHLGVADVAGGAVFNILMLPWPFSRDLFPLNVPAWSLFFEIVANLAMAVCLVRLQTRWLLILAIATCLGLATTVGFSIWLGRVIEGDSPMSGGATWATFDVGLLRVTFSFVVGMIVARSPRHVRAIGGALMPFLTVALLVALLAFHAPIAVRPGFDLAVIVIALPLLLIVSCRIEPEAWLTPALTLIGEISFALYAVHMPVAHAFQFLARRMEISDFIIAPAFLVVSMLLAWCLAIWFDVPARRWLSLRFDRMINGAKREDDRSSYPHKPPSSERVGR